jgi:hypothetical protein
VLVACWSVKGGSGTSAAAAMLALALGRWSCGSRSGPRSGSDRGASLLVDLTGDLPAVLGLPPSTMPGVSEWVHAAAEAGALARLVQPAGDGLRFLGRGERPLRTGDGDRAGERFADALAGCRDVDAGVTVADCGRLGSDAGVAAAVVAGASRSLLVLRPCYLAIGRALDAPLRPSGVVLIDEPGRALGPAEIEDTLGVPVVLRLRARPAIARAIDSGLLSWRPPRRLVRALVEAVEAVEAA